jgi:Ca2+-binding RTX toxin-like protein
MSGSVTVPGSSGSPVTITLNSTASLALATQIAGLLNLSNTAGTLQTDVTTPTTVTKTDGQFLLVSSGKNVNTTGFGYNYVSDEAGGNQIIVGPAASVITGGTAGDTIIGAGGDTIAAGGASSNTIFELASATPYDIASGPGNDTIDASGSGTVTAGAGSNLIHVGGGGTANVFSIGKDVIFGDFNAGDPASTINLQISGSNATVSAGYSSLAASVAGSASDALIFGGTQAVAGSLTVTDAGTNDTISAGSSQADVSLTGSKSLVFGDTTGTASLTVLDNGSNDTISAANGAATVTAGPLSGNLLVFGGADPLTFVGQGSGSATVIGGSGGLTFTGDAGKATVVGGTGGVTSIVGGSGSLLFAGGTSSLTGGADATVDGGSGGATLFGSAGQSLTYTGTQGSALYQALGGSETINASTSTTDNTFFASTLTGANDSIQGGSGADVLVAGSGADTLGGGGGNDQFMFMKSYTTGQSDIVTDFTSSSTYQFNFIDYGVGQTSESLITNATVGPSGTTISLTDGTTVTFEGLTDKTALNGHLNNFNGV